MSVAFGAAVVYVLAVFALGFALGAPRVLLIAPALGEIASVAIELPIMLAFSWFICGVVLRRWSVPSRLAARVAMGAMAFALLMACELGVSLLALGGSVSEHVAGYRQAPGALGLAAQLAFAAFPVARLRL
jgi:hypothetical protein